MNQMIEEPLPIIRDWCINKISDLSSTGIKADQINALALAEEFYEWIDISNDTELEYLAIEDHSWTKDQEIDIL